MENRIADQEIILIPYFQNHETAHSWYQDPGVCKQVDNIDHGYDLELLNRMYACLSTHGSCYYIRYNGQLAGDFTLQDNADMQYRRQQRVSESSNRHLHDVHSAQQAPDRENRKCSMKISKTDIPTSE